MAYRPDRRRENHQNRTASTRVVLAIQTAIQTSRFAIEVTGQFFSNYSTIRFNLHTILESLVISFIAASTRTTGRGGVIVPTNGCGNSRARNLPRLPEHTARLRRRIQVPRAQILTKLEGTGEHAEKVFRIRRVPTTDGLVELFGTREGELHVGTRRRIPRADVFVKRLKRSTFE